MTERTITVPTETEEQVYVCDYCGEASEEDDVVTYRANPDYPTMHFHPGDCLESVVLDEESMPDRMTYAEMANRAAEESHRTRVVLAMGRIDLAIVVGVPLLAGALWMAGAPLGAGAVGFWGAFGVLVALGRSRITAKKAAAEVLKGR